MATISPLKFSYFIFIITSFIFSTLTSCGDRNNSPQYSGYEVAGTSQLTVIIDSTLADRSIVDNSLYMELMTSKDTFFVKPINHIISFPKLQDSLTGVYIYYNAAHTYISGEMLQSEYQAIYFPSNDAKIVIDTYPFENPIAKQWLKNRSNQVYYEINFPKTGRRFMTSLVNDEIQRL